MDNYEAIDKGIRREALITHDYEMTDRDMEDMWDRLEMTFGHHYGEEYNYFQVADYVVDWVAEISTEEYQFDVLSDEEKAERYSDAKREHQADLKAHRRGYVW